MKRMLILVTCVLLLGGVAAAQVSFTGGPHAGIAISSFPKGVSDYYGLGFQFGAQGEVNIMKYFGVRASFDYNMFPLDDTKFAKDLAASAGVNASDLKVDGMTVNLLSINFSGLGKIPTGSAVTPYGIIGFGLNFLSASDPKITYQGQTVTGVTGPESETKFGLHFGAGSEFALGSVKLFAEVKYAMVFTKDETTGYVPITIGVNF